MSDKATKAEIKSARTILATRFPKCFVMAKQEKMPLKIDIFEDIRARLTGGAAISKRVLKATLVDYTSGVRYLRNMLPGAPRFDLDGKPDGWVTEDQARIAKVRLERREAWILHRYKTATRKRAA